jgi:hypothetical protein
VRSPALAVLEAVADRRRPTPERGPNIGGAERAATLLAGGALMLWGWRRPSVGSIVGSVIGGTLVYRGARGRSRLYEALGMSTARPGHIERVVTINRPAADLDCAWHDPQVRARVMQGAEAIDVVTDSAEDIAAWRAADHEQTGQLSLCAATGGRGTEVRLALDGVSAADADEILRRFKQLMEAGEIPTAAGGPAGRAA